MPTRPGSHFTYFLLASVNHRRSFNQKQTGINFQSTFLDAVITQIHPNLLSTILANQNKKIPAPNPPQKGETFSQTIFFIFLCFFIGCSRFTSLWGVESGLICLREEISTTCHFCDALFTCILRIPEKMNGAISICCKKTRKYV